VVATPALALTSQKVEFTTKPPANAFVGGSAKVAAEASSGLEVTIKTSSPACQIEEVKAVKPEATVTFTQEGPCIVEAKQAGDGTFEPATATETVAVSKKATQTVTFTTKPPAKVLVGESAKVAAEASSGFEVSIKTAGTACEVKEPVKAARAEATVAFTHEGSCVVEAEQAGTEPVEAFTAKETTVVSRKPQTIEFTSSAPASAAVGGSAYSVAAVASSGLPVALEIDPTSGGVCSISGSTVSFVGTGTCTINADQKGDTAYAPAHEHQSLTVAAAAVTVVPGPGPKPPPPPPPGPTAGNSNFTAGKSAFEPKTGRVIFFETITDPGTFTWRLTVPNGKFGVFASSKKCKAGFVRLSGRCRPSRVIFATGSASVPAGVVIFKLRPSPNALKALRNALRRGRGLLVTATFTFQSSRGGSPVTHTQTLRVKLKGK
jgi:hypothetical protein